MDIDIGLILLIVGGISVYMMTTAWSRKIQNRSFMTLSDEDRKVVFSAFAPFRKFNLVPAAALLIIYILMIKFSAIPPLYLNIGFGVFYLTYLVSTVLYIRQRLIKLGIDSSVVFSVVIGLGLQYLGMIVVLVAILIYFLLRQKTIGN